MKYYLNREINEKRYKEWLKKNPKQASITNKSNGDIGILENGKPWILYDKAYEVTKNLFNQIEITTETGEKVPVNEEFLLTEEKYLKQKHDKDFNVKMEELLEEKC
jgi:hypothetical protein